MKITKSQRNEIREGIKDLRRVLYLHAWTFDVSHMDSDDESGSAADITANHEYLQASIRIYPCFWKSAREDRRKMLLHEMIHAVLSELQHQFTSLYKGRYISIPSHQQVVEKTTSSLTNIIFDLI